ncbi:hypothetical protein [Iamia sp.]|uniref:hypothetical protein n=1 Tax=Iamia sp. TaxID=2722710 RepID=UPI002C89B55A|nr:hypothetical protein [Iamia sp.]HXH59446.1 hypothetical protein [Iamia sp.]
MERAPYDLEFAAADHPDPKVRHAGFSLNHPYVEQCWGAVLGPSGVAVLRRLPVLWADHEPARIPAGELARSLGLGRGTGANSRLQHALDRTTRFGLADWTEPGRALRVYTEVPPLDRHRLAQLPDWSHRAHDRLLTEHIDQLARTPAAPTQAPPTITERLDRLQQPPAPHRSSPVISR